MSSTVIGTTVGRSTIAPRSRAFGGVFSDSILPERNTQSLGEHLHFIIEPAVEFNDSRSVDSLRVGRGNSEIQLVTPGWLSCRPLAWREFIGHHFSVELEHRPALRRQPGRGRILNVAKITVSEQTGQKFRPHYLRICKRRVCPSEAERKKHGVR